MTQIGVSWKKEPLYAQKEILEVPGGGRLHTLILSSITVEGKKRVHDYFKKNQIDENDKVERSEKEVFLGRVASTVQQISRERDRRIGKS